MMLIISNFFFLSRYKKKSCVTMSKFLIAFVLEMPMLISQACVMKNMDNLMWSHLNWDIGMHLQFIINLILFVIIDIVSDDIINCWIVLFLTTLSIPFLYMLVYLSLVGGPAVFTPKGVSNFESVIRNDDNGILVLLYISMIIGVVGLYLWIALIVSLIVLVIACIYKSKILEKSCT